MWAKKLLFLVLMVMALGAGVVWAQSPCEPYRVYLTFDDGPVDDVTDRILNVLKFNRVPATFFVLGERLAGREHLVQRMIQEGHTIGVHMYTHDDGPWLPTEELQESWQHTEDAIRAALGPDLAPIFDSQPVHLVRPPGGAKVPFIAPEGVDALTYNWQVSPGDALLNMGSFQPVPKLLEVYQYRIEYGVDGTNWRGVYEYGDEVIILMHDRAPTAQALPALIKKLRETGAEFAALPRRMDLDAPGTMPIRIGSPLPEPICYED